MNNELGLGCYFWSLEINSLPKNYLWIYTNHFVLRFGIIDFNFTVFTLKGCAIIPQVKQGMDAGFSFNLNFFPNISCSQSDHHLEENLAKFEYEL